ncbi:MAG: VWA domain-containing protein [Acidobacteria bacterium]|nr:VWA domain-containing protein [Acidobacteriota bacterium]
MFYQKRMKSGLAVLLLCILVLSGWLGVGARGQSSAATTPDANRPRRAANEATPQPTPATPSKQQPQTKQQDDVTLQDDEVVRIDTDLTNILFTAEDKNRRFVTNLRKEDIRILEDGQPQEIFAFQTQIDLPLSLAILIDTSRSQERTLPDEKAAARAFIDAILRQGKDEAAVVSFTGESTLEQGLTGNVARLRQAIDHVEFTPPSGYVGGGVVVGTPPISGSNNSLAFSTSLWDAIWVTANDVLSEAADNTRRAIIIVTDGDDTSSRKKIDDAIQRALKADALIFAIGIGDSYQFRGVDEGALRKVAERTGGRAYFPRDESDLRAAFTQIEKELREQYLIAYAPTNQKRDGSYRRVQLEVVNPELRSQNIRLNYRQGYFAKGEEKPAGKTGK